VQGAAVIQFERAPANATDRARESIHPLQLTDIARSILSPVNARLSRVFVFSSGERPRAADFVVRVEALRSPLRGFYQNARSKCSLGFRVLVTSCWGGKGRSFGAITEDNFTLRTILRPVFELPATLTQPTGFVSEPFAHHSGLLGHDGFSSKGHLPLRGWG